MSGFQSVVFNQPAPGVVGDFAGNNPRSSVLSAVEGGLRTKASEPILVGNFAWAGADGICYNDSSTAGTGATVGFVARVPNEPNCIITAFLGESTLQLMDGAPCTLMNGGEYWASFPAGIALGTAVYATATTGVPNGTASGTNTGFTAVSVVPAPAVSGTGATIALNTGVLTVDSQTGGNFDVGQLLTGTNVPAKTYITALGTGTGGAGTYYTNSLNRAAVAATTITGTGGTLAKISKVAA